MTEAAERSESARLDELAAVTREYARYSRSSFGIAGIWAGAWLLVPLGIRPLSANWASLPPALAAALWLIVLARARTSYQRRGRVTEDDPKSAAKVFFLGALWVVAPLAATVLFLKQSTWATSVGSPAWAGLAVAAGALAGAPLAARGRVCSTFDLQVALWLAFLAAAGVPVPGRGIPLPFALFVGGIGIIGIVVGMRQHVRYRRLERRLAALKEATP